MGAVGKAVQNLGIIGFLWGFLVFGAQAQAVPTSSSGDAAARDQRQYSVLSLYLKNYPAGAEEVLKAAYDAVREHHTQGKAPLVELADLWTEALQENSGEFGDPGKLWGPASPEDSLDMLGQTAIGPWQITTNIIQEYLGAPYGIPKEWGTKKISAFCRKRHDLQAAMAMDDIERNYETYGGKRSPYALQYYFWLEAFVKGDIGQGPWDSPVLVPPDPATGKSDESPEKRKQTGFYGKQILLGWKDQPHGLLFWLWAVGDFEGIKAALRAWRDQVPWEWVEKERKFRPIAGAVAGQFSVIPSDIKYCSCHPEFVKALQTMARSVLAEGRK